MLNAAHVDAYTWNLANFEMCALGFCAFWECASSVVVDRFVQDQRLQLNINRIIAILYRPCLPKWRHFLNKRVSFHMLEHTKFPSIQGYVAAKTALEFD